MGGCSVIGCKNRVEKGGKHFYRFPKNDKRKFWAIFTKRGLNWTPKDSNTICEVHFAENCFVTKQKRMFLTKESVPTIYYSEKANGSEVLTISYNGSFENYSSFIKHEVTTTETAKPVEVEESKEVLEKKQERLKELKTICRFCMEKKEVLIEIKNFLAYNISYTNLLTMMDLTTNYRNYLSDLVCEDCFNQIVLLDTFKIKCKSAEMKILNELKELKLDLKLSAGSVIETTIEDFQNDTENGNGNFNESTIQSTFSLNQISEINSSIDPKDIYEDLDEIIKNPKRNKFVLKVFECFFCKKKFGGKRTFNSHACSVKEIKCDECDKVFDKEQAYKSHKIRAHGSNQLEKHFCPMCKNVIMGNNSRFQKHRKKCNQERVSPINCEICGKGLETLSGYTIHKLFHESSKNVEIDDLKEFLGALCDICGKSYKTRRDMKSHMRIKHSNSSETYQCKICAKNFTNRPALNHHKYNSHKVQESPCNICGKIFRNKVLLRKHKIYHDETKRIFKCLQCPDKPGYFTKVALKRHQRSHIVETFSNHDKNLAADNDVTECSRQQIEPIVIKLF